MGWYILSEELGLLMGMKRKAHTDDKFRWVQVLVIYGMLLRKSKHAFDTFTSSLLAELHLQNSIVDGLP
jgi:hypothetical protein